MKITGAIVLVVIVLKFLTNSIWPDFEPGLGLIALVWVPIIAILGFGAFNFWEHYKNFEMPDPKAQKDEPREP